MNRTFLICLAACSLCLIGCDRDKDRNGEGRFYAVARSGLLLRDQPSLSGKIIGKIPYGGEVELAAETFEQSAASEPMVIQNRPGRWRKVRGADGEGYVFGGFLNSRRIDPEKVKRGDFRGLIFYNLPSGVDDLGGGQIQGDLWYARVRRGKITYVLLQKENGRAGPYAEWLVLDQLKFEPLGPDRYLERGTACVSIGHWEERDAEPADDRIELLIHGGPERREGERIFSPIQNAWGLGAEGNRFVEIKTAGKYCELPGHF